MTGFNLNFDEVYEGNGKVEDGWYEVVVGRCNEDATPSGAEYTEFDLIIRNDIDQPSKNMHIFHKVWKAKADNKYNMKMFNTIGKACKLENGKTYKSFEELLNDFVRKPALVYVENETNEYNGKTYENLTVKIWRESTVPQVNHTFKDKNNNSNQNSNPFVNSEPANDDNLPF